MSNFKGYHAKFCSVIFCLLLIVVFAYVVTMTFKKWKTFTLYSFGLINGVMNMKILLF